MFIFLHAVNLDGYSSQVLYHLVTDVPTRIFPAYIPELQNTLNGLAEDPGILFEAQQVLSAVMFICNRSEL